MPNSVIRTRERILEAALDLFAEEGYRGTTITEIERRVGLTPGTGSFYRHFRSKEDVLQAAVAREVARCVDEAIQARTDLETVDDPELARVQSLERMLRDIRRFERLLRLVMTEGDRVPELREAMTTALAGPGERLAWADDRGLLLGLSALGGYYLFSLVQGRPFQGVSEGDFIEALAELTS